MNEKINENKIEDKNFTNEREGGIGVEIKKTLEFENLTESLSVIASSVNHDDVISTEQLKNIKNGLGSISLEVGGKRMTIEEFRNSPNAIIWKEIENGNIGNMDNLTFITPKIAEILTMHKGKIGTYLTSLKSLTDEIAEVLSNDDGELLLNGIEELSISSARSLAKRKGVLGLRGLKNISPEVSKELSCHEGEVRLDGITNLSLELIEGFSKNPNNEFSLSLNGVTDLSYEQAEALSRIKNRGLYFWNIPHLSKEVIEKFLNYKGRELSFIGLKEVSEEEAEALNKLKELIMSSRKHGFVVLSDEARYAINQFKNKYERSN